MKQGPVIAVAMFALAACEPPVPVDGGGVGFDDYANYEIERAQREAALTTSIIPPPQVIVVQNTPVEEPAPTEEPTPAEEPAIPASALADAGIGETTTEEPAPTATTPLIVDNPDLSDEQDFDAVAERETIESDAERRAAQAAAREQVVPTAVPERPRDTGPNIVEYAINAPNAKGQEWYSRSILSSQARYLRNCAKYSSPDDAQRAFLARGGPERDRLGLDPDGDGFACGWDPAPFRVNAGN